MSISKASKHAIPSKPTHKEAAFRFSQSATFYDKKFYAKLKQSVPKICTLCTVYTQNSLSPCKENARQHANIRIILTLSK